MTVRPAIVVLLVAAVAVLPVALGASRVAGLKEDRDLARQRLQATIHDAEEVLRLRASQQTASEHRRPEQDVIARVNATLGAAGLPADHFGSVRQESDSALPGSAESGVPYRQQTVRIALRRLELPKLGVFLDQWRRSQELWTLSRIELTNGRDSTGALFDVTILMTATYVGER